jgi:hypothetical protein
MAEEVGGYPNQSKGIIEPFPSDAYDTRPPRGDTTLQSGAKSVHTDVEFLVEHLLWLVNPKNALDYGN